MTTVLAAPRRLHYRDRHGTLRRHGTHRRVRADYRMPRAHPHGCAHCAMVTAWREQAEAERDWCGGWRNETFHPAVTFGRWLVIYYREAHHGQLATR